MYRSVAFNRIHRNDDDDDDDDDDHHHHHHDLEYDKHELHRPRHYAARAS